MPVDDEEASAAPAAKWLADFFADDPFTVLSVGTPHADAVTVNPAALSAAQEIARTSRRRKSTPVRKLFVRGDVDLPPPMTDVYVGGRSGTVALKLFLALIWRCSTQPYDTDKPARAWATLLGLDDPSGKGARRVSAAMKTLAQYDLITITPQAGHPNLTTLLQEDQTRTAYEPPGDAYYRAKAAADPEEQRRHLYFLIPNRLWTEGHIQSLSGPGLVMLLILLAEQGGEGKPVWFSTNAFPERYHVSSKTRAAGAKELVRRQLLRIERQPLPISGNSSVFDAQRSRNVYHLLNAGLVDHSEEVKETSAARPSDAGQPSSAEWERRRMLLQSVIQRAEG